MKLSKEDLKRLVWHSQGGLNDCDSLAWLELIDGILNGRYDEPLEIEGYIREDHFADASKMGWTKFDQNDESTFPPCKGVYLVCRGVEPYFREAKFYGEKVGFGDTCVILWRPLPKLPLEIDGRYIREDRPECFSYDRKV